MLHARDDYQRIQDPEGKIPQDEPVFLIRGQDACAIAAIRSYIEAAKLVGAGPDLIDACRAQIGRIKAWQKVARRKVPDMPD